MFVACQYTVDSIQTDDAVANGVAMRLRFEKLICGVFVFALSCRSIPDEQLPGVSGPNAQRHGVFWYQTTVAAGRTSVALFDRDRRPVGNVSLERDPSGSVRINSERAGEASLSIFFDESQLIAGREQRPFLQYVRARNGSWSIIHAEATPEDSAALSFLVAVLGDFSVQGKFPVLNGVDKLKYVLCGSVFLDCEFCGSQPHALGEETCISNCALFFGCVRAGAWDVNDK